MAIKASVQSENKISMEYPVLLQSPNGLVVLFNGLDTGTVLHSGKSHHKIGEYGDDWIDATNAHHWTPVKSVTLSSE